MSLARRFLSLLSILFLLLPAACNLPAGRSLSSQPTAPTATLCPSPEPNEAMKICGPGEVANSQLVGSAVAPEQVGPQPVSSPLPASPTPPPATPTIVQASSPTPTPALTPCSEDICTYTTPLFLERPILPPDNDSIDLTYRFGSTQGGLRDPHHGVELLNHFGTTVVAAGNGVVVWAGTDQDPTSKRGDWPITYFGPYFTFYGNLIIIEHIPPPDLAQLFPDMPQPVYTLYAHLSEVTVQVGQQVVAGQPIGKVGMSGIAEGPHLHLEVRLGKDNYTSYKSSHNPELWLLPRNDENGKPLGALAGRFIDPYGNVIEMSSITLEHLPDGDGGPNDLEIHLVTYEEKGLRGQPPFGESFGINDLPPGWYRINYPNNGVKQVLVQVFPGQLTMVTIRTEP